MFLTRALLFYRKYKRVPGLLHAGKNRALPHISVDLKKLALRWMMLEQENLELLSKPYLTPEEEHGSTKHLKQRPENNFVTQQNLKMQARMLPNRTAKDIFTNLYKQRSWE